LKNFGILILMSFISNILFSQVSSSPKLKIGDDAPGITGIDQTGYKIESEKLIQQGAVVLIFYRGNWCPHCRRHLGNLQDSLNLLLEKGASVVVVTPEAPESIDKMVSKTGATFSIIHDQGYKIMNKYGVSFTISASTVPRYFNSVLEKTREANQNEDDILPIPATFIIDKDKRIKYIHYNPDYRKRMSIAKILRLI